MERNDKKEIEKNQKTTILFIKGKKKKRYQSRKA